MQRILVFLALLSLCFAPLCLAQDTAKPLKYINDRYAFSLELPPWFYVAKEADNGDGIIITDPTVLEIRAYGTMSMTPPESFEALVKQWTKDVGQVKKRILQKNEHWFLLQGVQALPKDAEYAEKFTTIKVLYGHDSLKVLRIVHYDGGNIMYPKIIDAAVASFKNTQ